MSVLAIGTPAAFLTPDLAHRAANPLATPVAGPVVETRVSGAGLGLVGGGASPPAISSHTPGTSAFSPSVAWVPGVSRVPVGQEPKAEVYDPANGFVYVANFESGTVTVINGTSVTTTLGVGSYPIAIAYDSGNDVVYVANWASLNVSAIAYDATGHSFAVTSVPVGSRPDALAVDTDNGNVYVANENSNNVTVLSNATAIANLPVGTDPKAIAYSPVYDRVYVANAGAGTVTVLHGTKVEATLTVGTSPVALAYDPQFPFAPMYVANSGSNNLSVLVGTESVAGPAVGNDPTAMAVNPVNGDLYVANTGSANVSVLTLPGLVTAVPVGGSPTALAYNGANGFVYVANAGTQDVSVILGTSLVVATVPVGSDPVALVYDSGTGKVYAADYTPGVQSGDVAVLSESAVIGSVPVGGDPVALACDPVHGYVYVANALGRTVSILSGMTVVATLNVTADPTSFAYDPYNGLVYVGEWNATTGYNPGLIEAINGTQLVAAPPVNVGLVTGLAMTVDPTTGLVYVAAQDFFAAHPGIVSIISGTQLLDTITVGFDPFALTYNAHDGTVYVTNLADTHLSMIKGTKFAGNVTGVQFNVAITSGGPAGYVYAADYYGGLNVVVNGTLNTRLVTGLYPHALDYNPVNGLVYAANLLSSSVTAVVGNVSLGNTSTDARPVAVAHDARTGLEYVSNAGGNDTSVLSGTAAAGVLPIGTAPYSNSPGAATYDPVHGFVYVATSPSTVSVIGLAPLSVYSFRASSAVIPSGGRVTLEAATSGGFGRLAYTYDGLPPGCAGSNAPTLPCTPTAAGSYVVRLTVADSYGETTAATAHLTVFAPATYSLAFTQAGLRAGTNWSVSLNGTTHAGTTAMIMFAEPNGTYPYNVPPVGGYVAHPSTASVTVAGASKALEVTFALAGEAVYDVTFGESGLLPGVSWSVTLNGTLQSTNSGTIRYSEPNGSYGYSVGPVLGYTATPASGAARVAGAPTAVTVSFTRNSAATYTVAVVATGLPPVANWSVTVDGELRSGTASSFHFVEPNGSYPFSIGVPSGFTATPDHGTVTVSGAAVTETITFRPANSGNVAPGLSFLGPSSIVAWAVVAAAVGTLAVLGLRSRFRRRGAEPEPISPWVPPPP